MARRILRTAQSTAQRLLPICTFASRPSVDLRPNAETMGAWPAASSGQAPPCAFQPPLAEAGGFAFVAVPAGMCPAAQFAPPMPTLVPTGVWRPTLPSPLATAGVPLATAGVVHPMQPPRPPLASAGVAAVPLVPAGVDTPPPPPPPPPLAEAGALRSPIYTDLLRFWAAELEHAERGVAPQIELHSFGRQPDAGVATVEPGDFLASFDVAAAMPRGDRHPACTRCSGHNGAIQLAIVRHAGFGRLWTIIRRQVMRIVEHQACNAGRGPCTIGVFCTRGRHRSVGVTILLARILRDRGVNVVEIHHHTRHGGRPVLRLVHAHGAGGWPWAGPQHSAQSTHMQHALVPATCVCVLSLPAGLGRPRLAQRTEHAHAARTCSGQVADAHPAAAPTPARTSAASRASR